jgi:hypothetical protein
LTIFNPMRPGVVGLGRPVVAPVVATAGANIAGNPARQNRFDDRSRRRYGDWSVLGGPAALLWLEAAEMEDAATDPDNPNSY